MKIVLSLEVENMKAFQNFYLKGIPSPITVLSFVENLLIKTNLHNPEDGNSGIKVAYGIRKFQYSKSKYIRKFLNKDVNDHNTNSLVENSFLSNLSIQITFDINSKKGSDFIKEEFKKVIPFLRFKGGLIKENYVSIDNGNSLMYPTFMIYDSQLEFSNVDEFIDHLEDYQLQSVIKGYNFLTKIKDDKVFAESAIGFVKLEALRKVNEENIHFWKFLSEENNLKTIGEVK